MEEPESITYSIEKVPDLFGYEEYEISFQKGKTKIRGAYNLKDIASIRAYILRDYKGNRNSPQGIRPLKIHLNGLAENEQFRGLEEWVINEATKIKPKKQKGKAAPL